MSDALRRVAAIVKAEGHKLCNQAAYNGRDYDREGMMLMREADAFICGLDGKLPAQWKHYAEDANIRLDPEYPAYMRLKAKFERRT